MVVSLCEADSPLAERATENVQFSTLSARGRIICANMSGPKIPDVPSLFTRTLDECRELYVSSGKLCAHEYPHLISKKGGDYKIALRVQRQSLLGSEIVEQMKTKARGEADVRYVGRVTKRAARWYRSRLRPLSIGGSVAHYRVTAGTIGAFVRGTGGEPFLLSNNHVLANEDDAKIRDDVLQPGPLDGGRRSADLIGRLRRWVKMKRYGNIIDAAIAERLVGFDLPLDEAIAQLTDSVLEGLRS